MSTVIVGLIVAGVLAFAAYRTYRSKKSGGCGCGCTGCSQSRPAEHQCHKQ